MTEQKTYEFQADVARVLDSVIHSLYSNKDIFLRELISNASDALDKLRFLALEHPEYYDSDPELSIRISFDREQKTLTISDNGIGMDQEEIVKHLGTIAHSGTREFLQNVKEKNDSRLIGQFGMGFYSAFIVADRVAVRSRRAGSTQGVCWESEGTGHFQVSTIEKSQRGTEVVLHLKEDEVEFLDGWRLRSLIRKYSDHVSFPIQLPKESLDEKTLPTEAWEQVNKATALWQRSKNEIPDDEYKEFYKHLSHDYEDPLLWSHNKVEGKNEYTSLLYVPAVAPLDLWNRERPRGLKLYVQRVFIMDQADSFLPIYLRFVQGVVDSSNLPLNLSREVLQNNRTIESMKQGLTQRVLSMLERLSSDDVKGYQRFWNAFGTVLKEGIIEDPLHRESIAKLLRFHSTADAKASEPMVSLSEYVARMAPDQEAIYFLTAESLSAGLSSPHLEWFRKKGYEVLILTDRIDEWVTDHLQRFADKPLKAAKSSQVEGMEENIEDRKQQQQELGIFLERAKALLSKSVKDVRLSSRLTDSPSCLVSDQDDMSLQMQRILKTAGQTVPEVLPILEINPNHRFAAKFKNASSGLEEMDDWIQLLWEEAVIAEGTALPDPGPFVARLNRLLH